MNSSTTANKPIERAPKHGQLERTEARVMQAVSELLGEVGIRGLSIDLVAQTSGVGRATIYRRWKTVPMLALSAFEFKLGPGLPAPDHGDLRTDLVHLYRRFAKVLGQEDWARMLPAIIEAAKRDPDFEAMLARLDQERRTNSLAILKRAQGRGELHEKANLDWIIDALSGPLYYRFLIAGGSIGEPGFVEWVVDAVIQPFLHEEN